MKLTVTATLLCCALAVARPAAAQEKLTMDNIQTLSLRNSGTILSGGEVKGYFFFYISDKIDKHTNEYTINVLDENLKQIKKITLTDDAKEQLLETSFEGNTLLFMFYNEDTKMVTNKIYGLDGKLKYTYPKELDKRSNKYFRGSLGTGGLNDEAEHDFVYDIEGKGYLSLVPLRDGKDYSYEINIYRSDMRKSFTYMPDSEVKFEQATFLGATDSLLIFETLKKNKFMSHKMESFLLGISLTNGRKMFEVPTETAEYKYFPLSISTLNGKSDFLVLGTYYDLDDNVMKDKTLGISAITLNSKGKVTAKKFNSWESDFGKFLNISSKGKVEDIGYLYFHKIIQAEDGNVYAIAEGYRKTVDVGGIALNVLSLAMGGSAGASNTKLTITDMVLIHFNDKFGVADATVYKKNKNISAIPGADFSSPHMLAAMAKTNGAYDYDFTQMDKFHTNFYIGYSDYERSKEYNGRTFHSISYNGGKISTDKINLVSKASSTRIMPGKTGFIMVSEYFKKDKKLDLRLEKIN